ncbi:hypothetical protein E3N88_00284 [Mikania micrantha]|uniref:Uncharacterized protein n=1 Tax=Mikania micrantha TaxID=192012 RepID=A0A5N6PZQ5_9ASTR|nr:hypothetical protein E3N88_00284 [Mikania micrantha]
MTGCKSILNSFIPKNGGSVSFGNNAKGWIVGSGSVLSGKLHFKDVSLVENLKFNLLSVSQLAYKDYISFFTKDNCKILSPETNSKKKVLIDQHTLLMAKISGNVYVVDMTTDSQTSTPTCLIAQASSSETTLWHRRFSHLNHQTLHKLSTLSLTFFLFNKDETVDKIVTQLERQLGLPVKVLRSDNGTKFKNHVLDEFCTSKRILRQYSVPRTPAQNELWKEIIVHLLRVHIVKRHNKTAYEVFHKIKPLISFFRFFGCPCFILDTKDSLSKFAAKVDSGYFVGYSQTFKSYRAFNLRTRIIEESIDVKFNESASTSSFPSTHDDLFDLESFTYTPPASSMSPSSESCQTSEDLSSLEKCSVSHFFSSIPSHTVNHQDQNEHPIHPDNDVATTQLHQYQMDCECLAIKC